MVARLLNMMGAYFAPEGVPIGGNQENPKGLWERSDVLALNKMVLRSTGADWDRLSRFSLDRVPASNLAYFKKEAGKIILAMDAYRPWFLKEPRLCLLAPLWLELLEFPVCVFFHRSPLEVARSLEVRNGFSIAFGLALWERYVTEALNASLGRRRIQVNHADLIADPLATVRQLKQDFEALSIRGLRSPSDEEISAFIDPSLCRAKRKENLIQLSTDQRKLLRAFRNGKALLGPKPVPFSAAAQVMLTRHDQWIDAQEKIATLERRNANAEKEVTRLKSTISELRDAIERRNQWRENAEKEVTQLKSSISELSDALDSSLQAQRKLKELLKKAGTEIDRLVNSSRWKIGSALTFRKATLSGGKAKDRFVREFKEWEKTLPAVPSPPVLLPQSIKNDFQLPEIGRAIKSNGPAGKPASRVAQAFSSAVNQGQNLREFDSESIARITLKLSSPVSVIVPIYNNPEELQRCIDSVLRCTNLPFELILVDDCSLDPAIAALLEKYDAHSVVRILRNRTNQGFVRSANIGMKATEHDVVLLNSDTEVTTRWLQKLMIAAYSDPEVATVTPFSNAGGAFSVPEIGVNAPLPFPFTVLKIARLTERLSSCAYPQVPTGNGFCMYIKRQALDKIGGFDEENFGRGYGEENDFCMRALKAGWRHVIDDSLFVYHRGASSFGEEKERLLKQNREILDRLHPEYTGLVREFTNSSEINALRSRIGDRLKNGTSDLHLDKSRVLFILHEGSGGVPLTVTDIVSRVSETNECFLLTSTGSEMFLSVWQDNSKVEMRRWQLQHTWSAKNYRCEAARRVYFQVLNGLGIDLVHIHHLFKHSFDAPLLCRQMGIPVVLSFHDYYFACPSVHLLDQNSVFCGGQCTPGLAQCMIPSPMLRDLPMLKQYLPEWRREVAQVLDCCDAFVTMAESVRDVYLSAFPQLKEKPFWIIEHGRDFKPVAGVASPPSPGQPVRILTAGNIDHHKGSGFIRELKKLDRENLLEFHFLGTADENVRHIGVHHGVYARDDFARLARKIRPSFAAVFSIWGETYCHTLTEAWSVGLPVLGSQLGAVSERIETYGGGWKIDMSDPAGTLKQIHQIVSDTAKYQAAVKAVERIQFQTVEEMADDYRALYGYLWSKNKSEEPLRLGCIVPAGNRGSTFVRIRLPLAHEDVRRRLVAVSLPRRFTATQLNDRIDRLGLATILVQREALDKDRAALLVEVCRGRGIRLVFEIDDNLLEVKQSHADFAFYDSKIEVVRYLAESANQLTVSTRELQEQLLPLNRHTEVVENALDEWLWFSPAPAPARSTRSDSIIAGYMGTNTHGADLEMIRAPFLRARDRLLRDYDIRLVLQLIGGMSQDQASPPWYDRLDVPKGLSYYPRFVRWMLQTIEWDFGLAPLVMNPFNAAKSALKFLEYAALGLPGIFSAVGEYREVINHRQNGLLATSNSPQEWEELIVELASSESLRRKLAATARQQTVDHHLIANKASTWISTLRAA